MAHRRLLRIAASTGGGRIPVGPCLCAIAVALLLSLEALAWGNLHTHPDIGSAGIERFAFDEERTFESYLIEELDLRRGIKTELAVQLEHGQAQIDDDLVTGDSSRLETSFNRVFRLLSGEIFTREEVPASVAISVNRDRCEQEPTDPAFADCFEKLERFDVEHLLRNGLFAEDNRNVRARHHFHDPEKERPPGTGQRGMAERVERNAFVNFFLNNFSQAITSLLRGGGTFDFAGRSARDRALNTVRDTLQADFPADSGPASKAKPFNFFALPDAERYLYRGLTAPREDEREHYLALHVLAVGHVLHLLQDMTSPAHVRHDFFGDHILGGTRNIEAAGSEDYALELIRGFATSGAGLFQSRPREFLAGIDPAQLPGLDPVEYQAALASFQTVVAPLNPLNPLDPFDGGDFWDREPDLGSPLGQGVAERVHRGFFSTRTLNDDPTARFGYAAPRVPDCATIGDSAGTGAGQVTVRLLPARDLETGLPTRFDRVRRYLSSPLVPHLANCRYLSRRKNTPPRWAAYATGSAVRRDYLELLLPMAIDYTEQLMRWYFRPRIDVISVDEKTFRLANLSLLPLTAGSDAVELVYDGVDQTRKRVPISCTASGTFVLPAAPDPDTPGSESTFTCSLPESLPAGDEPANRADFWVVVRGQLGERGTIVPPDPAGDSTKWRDGDYVVAFRHVQGNEILLDVARKVSLSGGSADARRQGDILSVVIDPTHEVTDEDKESVLINHTRAVRDQDGDLGIDFYGATPEPGGSRVALRTDLVAPFEGDELFTQGRLFDVFIMDLALKSDDPGFLTPVERCDLGACVPARVREDFGVGVDIDWPSSGDALFFFDGESASTFNPSRLVRLDLATANTVRVQDMGFTDNPAPVIGDISNSCGGRSVDVSAKSATRIAVSSRCTRSEKLGPSTSDLLVVGVDVLLGDLALRPDGSFLDSVATKRFDLTPDPPEIVTCTTEGCGEILDEGGEGSPVWSPDTNKVAFLGGPDDTGGGFGTKLFVADLVEGTIRVVAAPSVGRMRSPTWSPGGDWIAFAYAGGPVPGSEIYVVRSDAEMPEEPRRVTRGVDVNVELSWRHPVALLLP